jgi:hypothetical protein
MSSETDAKKVIASVTVPLSQFLTVMNRRHGRLIRLQQLCGGRVAGSGMPSYLQIDDDGTLGIVISDCEVYSTSALSTSVNELSQGSIVTILSISSEGVVQVRYRSGVPAENDISDGYAIGWMRINCVADASHLLGPVSPGCRIVVTNFQGTLVTNLYSDPSVLVEEIGNASISSGDAPDIVLADGASPSNTISELSEISVALDVTERWAGFSCPNSSSDDCCPNSGAKRTYPIVKVIYDGQEYWLNTDDARRDNCQASSIMLLDGDCGISRVPITLLSSTAGSVVIQPIFGSGSNRQPLIINVTGNTLTHHSFYQADIIPVNAYVCSGGTAILPQNWVNNGTDASVYAVVSGVVVDVSGGSGTESPYVVIRGDDGLFYVYLHVDPLVEEDDRVESGVSIGVVPSAAFQMGDIPHVHFEVRSTRESGLRHPRPYLVGLARGTGDAAVILGC